MSKINVEFDTVEKTLAVSIDGKAVENVAEVYVSKSYSDEDAFGCSVTTWKQNKDNGTAEMTRVVASESGEGKTQRAVASSSAFSGFVELPTKSKAQADIEAFFAQK